MDVFIRLNSDKKRQPNWIVSSYEGVLLYFGEAVSAALKLFGFNHGDRR